jgi:cell division topological specificity factor
MIEFFKRLFAPEQSGATAKERLRLVLLSDHLSLAPDVVESLRADLIAVISKYVEVDEANCDVSFEQQDRAVAVLANIPILAMRERTPPATPPGGSPPPGGRPAPPPSGGRPDPPPVVGSVTAAAVHEDLPRADAPPPTRRRKRRRRAAHSPAQAT